MHAGQVGITFYMPDALAELTTEEPEIAVVHTGVTGITMLRMAAMPMENFVFFLLPVIVAVAGAIFSHGTVKNDLARGMSRTKLYLLKLLLATLVSVKMMLTYFIFCFVLATILGGFGGPVPPGHWLGLAQLFFMQLLLMLSFVGVGIFLAFVTKSVAAINGGYIAFAFVPMFILTIVIGLNADLIWLLDFEMLTNIKLAARIPYLETREILRLVGLGAFIFIGTTIGGITLFRRSEIK